MKAAKFLLVVSLSLSLQAETLNAELCEVGKEWKETSKLVGFFKKGQESTLRAYKSKSQVPKSAQSNSVLLSISSSKECLAKHKGEAVSGRDVIFPYGDVRLFKKSLSKDYDLIIIEADYFASSMETESGIFVLDPTKEATKALRLLWMERTYESSPMGEEVRRPITWLSEAYPLKFEYVPDGDLIKETFTWNEKTLNFDKSTMMIKKQK